jgi:hypothetical protein
MRRGFVLACLCLPAVALAAESAFMLQLEGEGVAYEVLLNGKSVTVQKEPSTFSSMSIPVNRFLNVGAENTLEVQETARRGTPKLAVTLKEGSAKAPVLQKNAVLAGGQKETWRFQLPAGLVLAKQLSIFPEAAATAEDIKLYSKLASSQPGVKGVLRLNGVQIDEMRGEGGTVSGGSDMMEWLMPGENRFELEITQLPPSSATRPWYRFSLHGLPGPGFAGDENKIYGFDWPASDGEAKTLKKVFVYQLTSAAPSQLWSKAERISELSAEEKSGIEKLLKELTSALQRKDVKKASTLWRFRFEELGRMFGSEGAQAAHQQEEMMKEMLKRAKLSFVPPAQLQYTRVAGDKVVQVTGPHGEAPVRGTVGKDGKVNIPVFVAKLDGAWALVR